MVSYSNGYIKIIFIIFITAFSIKGFCEAIFLKDGSIVEGKIIKDTNTSMIVRLPDKKIKKIRRKNVIRTLYIENYKDRVFIEKKDGKTVSGFIVDENRHSYILREELFKPNEIRLFRNEVKTITKEKNLWASKYLGISIAYILPVGQLWKEVKGSYTWSLSYSNSHANPLHLGLFLKHTPNMKSKPGRAIRKMDFLYIGGTIGYNLLINERLVLKMIAGVGFNKANYSYDNNDDEIMGAGFHFGIHFPVRVWREFCLTPYFEYWFTAPYSSYNSRFLSGVMVQI